MNKLKTVINSIRYAALLLVLILSGVTVNGQNTPQNNTSTQDTIPVTQPLDTVPDVQKRLDSIPVNKVLDTVPGAAQRTDSIKSPGNISSLDTIKERSSEPIILEKNKKYLLGGISVVGNETISEQSILIFSGLNSGQRLKIPGDKLSSAIKRLWSSKLFSNVDVYVIKLDGDAVYLEVVVRELDKVGTVTIKGLKKSKTEDLRKEIEFQAGSMLTENLITTTENFIKDKYREKGYLKTKVTINTKKDTSFPNTQDALIAIDKGNRIKIKNITFHGNTALSDKKLKKTMKKTKEKGITRLFSPSKFVEDLYDEDLDKVVSLFQEKGFRDALIVKDSLSWNDDNTINLDIFLTQGDRYKFGQINYLGNTVFTDEQLQSISKNRSGSYL